MYTYRSKPLKYPWPTALYLFAVILAGCLQAAYPLRLPISSGLSLVIGATAALGGAHLALWAAMTLVGKHTAVFSNHASTHLVTSGPFRVSRNPIYLGYTLLALGTGVAMGSAWLAAAAIIAAATTHLYVIRREEMHLLGRFGYDFERYRRTTRAWI